MSPPAPSRRSWLAKLREAIAAWKLERRWNKSQILAAYLNRASYGNRRLGPEAAARAYFGKSAAHLTLAESIYLAGLPQAPSRFNPWLHPAAAAARYRRVARPPRRRRRHHPRPARSPRHPARRPALRAAPSRAAISSTRSSGRIPASAARSARRSTSISSRPPSGPSAPISPRSIAPMSPRHRWSSSRTPPAPSARSSARRITRSPRSTARCVRAVAAPRSSPSSTSTPSTTASSPPPRCCPDTPDAIRDAYADYDPQDFTRRCLGPVRVREALACSLNVPAVVTLSRLGARPAFFSLQKWGFNFGRSFDDYGAGFILGNAEIRLVDLAAAYAGLARGGLALPARFIESRLAPVTRMASPEATAIITDILCDNDARSRAFGPASPLALKQRVAAKTGTSSGFRDAWTVGFDKEHTVAVWAGNFDGHPLGGLLAIRAAAPLWAATMNLLLRNDHPLPPPPATLVRRDVCALTGLLPCPKSPATIPELFLPGTEPRDDASSYFSATGTLLLPPEYAAWCATPDNTIGAQVRPEPRILTPTTGTHYIIDNILPACPADGRANLNAPRQSAMVR